MNRTVQKWRTARWQTSMQGWNVCALWWSIKSPHYPVSGWALCTWTVHTISFHFHAQYTLCSQINLSHPNVSFKCKWWMRSHHCTCRTYLRFAAFSSILYIVDCFSFNLHLFDQVAFVSFCFLSLSGPVCVSFPCFLPLPWQWHRPQSVFIFIRWHCCCRCWYVREGAIERILCMIGAVLFISVGDERDRDRVSARARTYECVPFSRSNLLFPCTKQWKTINKSVSSHFNWLTERSRQQPTMSTNNNNETKRKKNI